MSKLFKARYLGNCQVCQGHVNPGDWVCKWYTGYAHHTCAGGTYTNLDEDPKRSRQAERRVRVIPDELKLAREQYRLYKNS